MRVEFILPSHGSTIDTAPVISIDSSLYPTKLKLFYRTMWHYLPDWVLDILEYTPTRELKRVRETSRLFRQVAEDLLREKGSEVQDRAEEGHKDVLSILGTLTRIWYLL